MAGGLPKPERRLALFEAYLSGLTPREITAALGGDLRNNHRALKLEVMKRGLTWRTRFAKANLNCHSGFNYIWDGGGSRHNRRTT